MISLLIVLYSLFMVTAVPAQEVPAEEEEVYRLPEAEVRAERDTPEVITREEMERDGASDLWEAVRYTPGVILSGGGRRNDSAFSVRGFGADSVPVYVDGIEMANPYRGESDNARMLTGDLESIEIEKGYSSELLGANNLGGAILLRTAKPKNPFEASLKTTFDFDSIAQYAGSNYVLNLGTKQNLFYAKGVFQYRMADHWRLPDSFEPFPNNPQEKGDRLWSDAKDLKLTLLAGITPIPALDTWITYIYQDAVKGTSPPDTNTRDYEIWDWPVWKRQSISLNSVFSLEPFSMSALFYFDTYDNRLDVYYKMKAYELGIHDPHSDYDEYTVGGRLTAGWDINSWNRVQGALTYKKEDHVGLRGSITNEDELSKEIQVNEDTWSLGLEYTVNPWTPLTLKAGLGFDALIPNEYWSAENEYLKLLDARYFIVQTRDMFLYTWQAGVFYRLTGNHEVRFTYARKNHFPTMAQRYSTRFGRNLPNPRLGPEIANHFELGYRGYFADFFPVVTVNAALYYSLLNGKIVDIELPNPLYPSAAVAYSRNLDSVSFFGFEFAPELALTKHLNAGFAFSVNAYTINQSQDAVKVMPYYPHITLNGYMVIKPVEMLSIIPRIEYIGSRYADTDGVTLLDGYVLGGLKVSAQVTSYVLIEAGVDNIFDTFYEIRKNSPMQGRTYTLSLTATY
jgi:iron complex outermembrane receptor protein